MLKVGLRFPLSSFHRELLQHLGLSVNQVSPNAWRVFIAVEVLYGVMSDGVRRLTVWEFLNYYRPNEIDKSKGMYSFIPRSPLLRLVYKTPDSNRNWKSSYFFLEGNEWMVVQGTQSSFPSTQLGAYCIRLVCTRPNAWVLLIVQFSLSPIPLTILFLQFDGVHRLLLKNGAF